MYGVLTVEGDNKPSFNNPDGSSCIFERKNDDGKKDDNEKKDDDRKKDDDEKKKDDKKDENKSNNFYYLVNHILCGSCWSCILYL